MTRRAVPEANPLNSHGPEDRTPAQKWSDALGSRRPQGAYTTGVQHEKYREAMAALMPHLEAAATEAQRVRLNATWFQRTFRKKWLRRQALLAHMAVLRKAREDRATTQDAL